MAKVKIIGAGMAGLIAGHMLRRFSPEIYEASPSLPSNHSALLRFRSDAVSRATAIPFKQVTVRKGLRPKSSNVLSSHPTIQDVNSYAEKVSGIVQDRSIVDLSTSTRFVAPSNFLSLLAETCPAKIHYGSPITELELASKDPDEIWISTLPMPMMLKLADKPISASNGFQFKAITTVVATIQAPLTSVYQTVYLPYDTCGSLADFYRISISGNQLIMEAIGEHPNTLGWNDETVTKYALNELFGLTDPIVKDHVRKVQKYGKMVRTDEDFRRSMIVYLTERHNIFSLGRYATWRPLLLDDVVKDVEVIERLMANKYSRALQS
jgi:hypothetical protein